MDKQTDKLTSLALKGAFKKGIEVLLQHKDEVNALNVFPVPDGDTGSNMSACMLEALKEIDKITFESMKNVVQAIRTGTLMGARGNSGVILSQIFSGFCATITNANVSEISIPLFAEALKKGKRGGEERRHKARERDNFDVDRRLGPILREDFGNGLRLSCLFFNA